MQLQRDGCERLTTWVCMCVFTLVALCCTLVVDAALQESDLLLLGQQQRTRPVKTVRDSIAPGINGRALTSGAVEHFTIIPHYDSSTELLSAEKQRVLKTVLMESAVDWLHNAFRVRRMETPILFQRSCVDTHFLINGVQYCREGCLPHTHCGPVTVPTDHQASCRSCSQSGLQCRESESSRGEGVKGGHFLLYISALDQPHCREESLYSGLKLVQGGHCLQEQEYNRPVAGYLNFCPGFLSTIPSSFPRQQHAVMHQLLHTLAFSEELFPYYYNEKGYPRTRRTADGKPIHYPSGKSSVATNTVRLVHRGNWTTLILNHQRTVSMIVTPNVLREVRAHFNCESLEGAELEDQGGKSVAGRHWESRVFGEELMTGVSGSHRIISRVTMALLHDSGWYLPDYSYAGPLLWGRNKGCGFVKNSCGGWLDYQDDAKMARTPFCNGRDFNNGRSGCVNGRTSVGACLIHNYTLPLPEDYQYLSRRRGGTQILADYCPLYGTWEYGDYRVGHSCIDYTHSPPSGMNFALEEYGAGSRCFEQSEPLARNITLLNWSDGFGRLEGKRGGVCYKFSCSAKRILVRVGNLTLKCGREGQKKRFKYVIAGVSYRGSIVCPSYTELCQAYDCINRCSDHGTCHEGQCHCYPGYYGDDCSYAYASKLLSCANVTCLNRSVCTEKNGAFFCHCPSELTGQYCERTILPDPCQHLNCSSNGRCARTNHGQDPKCNCYRGYSGRKCTLLSDLCAENDAECLNNGTCATNTTRCICPPEFWGSQCQNIVNYCLPTNPCPLGHICTHHNNTQNYSCSCPHGYTGANCSQLVVDYCASSPCINGTCVNGPDGYKCVCYRGYRGKRCKLLGNPCKHSPCVGGNCTISMGKPWGSISCHCDTGYTGEYCELTT